MQRAGGARTIIPQTFWSVDTLAQLSRESITQRHCLFSRCAARSETQILKTTTRRDDGQTIRRSGRSSCVLRRSVLSTSSESILSRFRDTSAQMIKAARFFLDSIVANTCLLAFKLIFIDNLPQSGRSTGSEQLSGRSLMMGSYRESSGFTSQTIRSNSFC